MIGTTDRGFGEGQAIRDRRKNARSGGLRHAVTLPARIEWKSGGGIKAEICDISSIGMYLSHVMLEEKLKREYLGVGDEIVVTFAPEPMVTPDDKISMAAKIMRSNQFGVGVRFLSVDAQQRHALRMLALLAVESRLAQTRENSESEQAPRYSESDARTVTGACRKIIERRLANIVWTLCAEVAKKLLLMRTSDGQKVLQEAKTEAEIIQDKGTAIGRTAARQVVGTFTEMSGLADTHKLVLSQIKRAKSAELAARKMDLVEDDAFASSVAMETTARRMEAALLRKSFFVNVRLANVLGRRVDNIENPLAPAVMSRMLWLSVTQYCESPRVHECLNSTIVDQIKPLLVELYEDLGKALDELGVDAAFGDDDTRKR